ncbi:hypothetical protein Tco_1430968 [Tanacetum coccineum]
MTSKIIFWIRHTNPLINTTVAPAPHHPTDPLRSLGIRTEIPEFDGKLHPDDFLDWLQTVERIFGPSRNPASVGQLVDIKLKKYASLWWEHINYNVSKNGKTQKSPPGIRCQAPLFTWPKFLPLTFKQDAFMTTKTSTGSLSVKNDTYYWLNGGVYVAGLRSVEIVDRRFLGVLRPDIADAVSLHIYLSFSACMQIACELNNKKHARPIQVVDSNPSTRTTNSTTISPQKPGPTKTETQTVTTAPLDLLPAFTWLSAKGLESLNVTARHNNCGISLRFIQGQAKLKPRHAKWVEMLQDFSFVIRHKAGSANTVADALSRRPVLTTTGLFDSCGGFENSKLL